MTAWRENTNRERPIVHDDSSVRSAGLPFAHPFPFLIFHPDLDRLQQRPRRARRAKGSPFVAEDINSTQSVCKERAGEEIASLGATHTALALEGRRKGRGATERTNKRHGAKECVVGARRRQARARVAQRQVAERTDTEGGGGEQLQCKQRTMKNRGKRNGEQCRWSVEEKGKAMREKRRGEKRDNVERTLHRDGGGTLESKKDTSRTVSGDGGPAPIVSRHTKTKKGENTIDERGRCQKGARNADVLTDTNVREKKKGTKKRTWRKRGRELRRGMQMRGKADESVWEESRGKERHNHARKARVAQATQEANRNEK